MDQKSTTCLTNITTRLTRQRPTVHLSGTTAAVNK